MRVHPDYADASRFFIYFRALRAMADVYIPRFATYNRCMESMHNSVMRAFSGLAEKDAAKAAPLVLAYIGDTVYDLYVRTMLIHSTDLTAHGLHMKAIGHVRASAQAAAYRKAEPLLTEEEIAVYKRGRNASISTVPKHAEMADYRAATGFEALVGYLYLCGRDERIAFIMRAALSEGTP